MKSTSGNYSIRKNGSVWSLVFNGQAAEFKHEKGAYYVAYLLLNPPDEPIHGQALEVKSLACFGKLPRSNGITEVADPVTGKVVLVDYDAIFEQRNLGLDENEGTNYVRRKIRELEAILEDDSATEPVKAEVQRELAELYAYEKPNLAPVMDSSQKAVRAVREAINHFHRSLVQATDTEANPHSILSAFATHVDEHIIIPSGRYSQHGHGKTKTGVAGRFTYEPPIGVEWEA